MKQIKRIIEKNARKAYSINLKPSRRRFHLEYFLSIGSLLRKVSGDAESGELCLRLSSGTLAWPEVAPRRIAIPGAAGSVWVVLPKLYEVSRSVLPSLKAKDSAKVTWDGPDSDRQLFLRRILCRLPRALKVTVCLINAEASTEQTHPISPLWPTGSAPSSGKYRCRENTGKTRRCRTVPCLLPPLFLLGNLLKS